MIRRILVLFLMLAFLPLFLSAQSSDGDVFNSQTQVVIKFDKIDWQTYEFYAIANSLESEIVFYEWSIDDVRRFELPRIRYTFDEGRHRVGLIAVDRLGNKKYDTIQLDIEFWSLYNNSFWWYIYGFVVILIIYYWTIKLVYLFNRQKVKKEVQVFLDVLDTHGYVEHMVESYIKSHKKK